MPCRNAGPYLLAAVQSVLAQKECLELLVAEGGSTDGTLQALEGLAAANPRLRIISRSDTGPADALNKAFRAARGTLIGWLNADDLMPVGALARAEAALNAHPEWLMVYGEGEEFNEETGLIQRYPTLPASVGLEGFRSHCFICQPAVVFRRSMGVLLGEFDQQWRTAFDFDYWMRAFDCFSSRIGYIPHLQGCTRLHSQTITNKQRSQVALEAIELIARHFGSAPATRLHNLGLELQLGLAAAKAGQSHTELLRELADQAAPWLESKSLENFRRDWHLQDDQDDQDDQGATSNDSKQIANIFPTQQPLSHRLLQAFSPQLCLNAPGSPADRATRFQQAIGGSLQGYRFLQTDEASEDFKRVSTRLHPQKANRPFGVNLIGHAFEVFGIGEDVRMAARALQSVGVPCCVVHHPAVNGAPCTDRSLEPLLCIDPNGGPYAFNLVCLAAPIQARWILQSGLDGINHRYTIAAWPWETRQWPEAWFPLLEVVDEVWPSSSFTAQALQSPADQAGLPMNVMTMAAEIPDPDRFCSASIRQKNRDQLGLPKDAVVFVYSFDLNSTAIRKNPMAALEAFQQAFPLPHLLASKGKANNTHLLSEHVALLIKTFPPTKISPEWNWLQLRAKEDQRIHLIEASLEREDLLAMYSCCDVFLSLHRSEGFGRGMAEAFQLGLDVIATDYGGNTDFCVGPLAHPVRCNEVPIPRGAYPCADGHHWGSPDLDHAAQLMQQVAHRRISYIDTPNTSSVDISCDPVVLKTYRDRFSLTAVGERYKTRLQKLWSRKNFT